MGYRLENNGCYCSLNPRWRLEKSDQSGAELRIQDGGAHKSRPCWKTAHQPRRRTGIGLTDFHGDTNHARVTQVAMMKTERLGSDCSLDRVVQSMVGQ